MRMPDSCLQPAGQSHQLQPRPGYTHEFVKAFTQDQDVAGGFKVAKYWKCSVGCWSQQRSRVHNGLLCCDSNCKTRLYRYLLLL